MDVDRFRVPRQTSTCSWDESFTRRKPARTYLSENRPHFRSKYDENPGRRGSYIHTCMEDPRASQRFLYRAEHIESFCGDATIEGLVNGSDPQSQLPVALMDDRKADLVDRIREAGICRSQKGPLSAQQLHRELSKPRYTTGFRAPVSTTSPGSSTELDEPDAERRLLYITDFNSTVALALLDTASINQADVLLGFICGYLSFTPSVGVIVSFRGFKKFALEFHLPYYAWRKNSKGLEDSRRMSDGKPLRRTQNVGFLDVAPSGARLPTNGDWLHESQISCLVSGLDDSSYIGYGFVDTYQDGCQSAETVSQYQNNGRPDPMVMDPLSGGTLPAAPPQWDPRVYFFMVLESRLQQVKHEWINVVSMVQKKICPYIQDYQISKDMYLSLDIENRGERLKCFHEWTGSTIRLLLELIHTLSKTVHALDSFQSYEVTYFLDDQVPRDATSSSPSLCLSAITKHVEEMRDQLKTLEHQEKVCNNIARELESYLALEDRNSTIIQLRTNENVKAITIIALLVSPPAVSAAIFSMQENVFPWKPSLLAWGLTTLVLYVLVGLVLLFLTNWSLAKTDQALRGQNKGSSRPGLFWRSGNWCFPRRRKPRGVSLRGPYAWSNGNAAYQDVELGDLGSPAEPASWV
ncbi:hypothetical protein F4780DRAFT_730991 [Xylariomycetidae sp. FL0641]|nr:hypothetical protein F4780DRAFT_730991 [Xylariomycetidae sp. FL0641]